MSTDGDQPLTRAELRARRAAEAARTAQDPHAAQEPGDTLGDDTPDVGPIRGIRPQSGVSAPDLEPPSPEAPATEPPSPEAPPAEAPSLRHPRPAIPAPTSPITTGLVVPSPPYRRSSETEDAVGPARSTPAPDRTADHAQVGDRTADHAHGPRRPADPRGHRFTITLLSVLGVLALVAAGLGAVSLTQGPRISQASVNTEQAIQTSGSRLTLTLSRRVDAIDAKQVSITPAVPFTVDAAGRSLGIRFTNALDDSTNYTVRITGVVAADGGPAADLKTSFTTPASRILLLQRGPGAKKDTIFTTDLTGKRATPVFQHARIDDYRVTADRIVVAVEEKSGSRLIVMNRDGSGQRDLKLPGVGYVSSVQLSDRGGYVGYSYSDRDLTETSGRASVLVTQPLDGKGKPRIVQVGGKDAGITEWQFVPDSSSLLFVDFDGALGLQDAAASPDLKSMGTAAGILGISRGTHTAVIQRTDGTDVQLDLTDGKESPLPASDPDYGDADEIIPFPGGTLRHVTQRDATGMPTGQAIVRVDDKGAATVVTEVSGTDAIQQTCVSPSGQYAAVVIAPDLPNNPYDDLLLPLPTTLHTQLFDLSGKKELPTLSGFDISWCGQAPQP